MKLHHHLRAEVPGMVVSIPEMKNLISNAEALGLDELEATFYPRGDRMVFEARKKNPDVS